MAQGKMYALTDTIPELTPIESLELQKVLQNPLVIKYFRTVGLTAVFEQASLSKDLLSDTNNKYLIELAYQKGIMHMADTVLNYTPVKEQGNGTS